MSGQRHFMPDVQATGFDAKPAAESALVVGQIESVVGVCSLTRPGGDPFQVKRGDPVCRGDILETTASGKVGIRFIDGTAFSLSDSARAVVKEFGGDGTEPSALFDISRGTFAFIAGEMAKHGRLGIETPFASIRGRAQSGGIGMLSLASLFFAALENAQAATTPPGTEDGIINIRDFSDIINAPFGIIELTVGSQTIFIDTPFSEFVVRGTSVSQLPLSPAQLQQFIVESNNVHSIATLGQGPTVGGPSGSGDPPPSGPPPFLTPINIFVPPAPGGPTGGPTGGGNSAGTGSSFIPPPSGDALPPPPTTATINVTLGTDNGLFATIASGGITRDNTPTITGTVTAANLSSVSIHLFDGTTDIGAAIFNGSNWSLTTSPLADGPHIFTAIVTDDTGLTLNLGPVIGIIDTQPPSVTITTDDSVLKIGDVGHLTFTLSEAATNFTVDDISVTGGTLSNFAGSGTTYTADFTPSPKSTTPATVNVAANTFTDTAGNDNDAAHLIMAVDTVSAATWSISGDPSVTEGNAASYTVHLAGTLQAGQTATIDLAVADISTTSADYANFAAAVTAAITGRADLAFDPNTGTLTYTGTGSAMTDLVIDLGAVDDTLVEGSEAYKLVLSNPGTTTVSDITLGTSEVITTILDGDISAIRLDGPGSVAEGDPTSNYTVSLTSGVGLGAGQSVTFTLDSASGTATEGTDFSALTVAGLTAAAGIVLTTSTGAGGVINVTATNTTAADLAAGAALLSFTIATTPDAVVEGPENFTVTLASAAAVVNPTITTSITDDDLRAIRLDGPGLVAEGTATGPYTVSLSGVGLGAGQSVTFTLDSASGTATEGTDFSALTVAGLTAAAGIVLTTSTGAGGVINVTATNTTAADLATGAALLSFTIATTPDAVVEGPENFTVTLASAAAVANPTITTSIADDDLRAIRLDGPGLVAEGTATGPYTVSLSGVGLGAGQSVTFTLDSASGTATEGTDFSALTVAGLTAAAGIVLTTSTGAGGVINVTATNTTAADLATGAALLSFTIATTPDAVVEGPENFTVTLASAAAVVNPTITTSIADDDLQGIRLDGPGLVAEGAATGPYTVSLSGVGLGAGQSVTFTLDSASGTATEGTDFSALTVAGLTPAAGIVLSTSLLTRTAQSM